MRSNRSFDADTHRQGAASRVVDHASRGALPVRAGQLRRYATPCCKERALDAESEAVSVCVPVGDLRAVGNLAV